MAFNLEHIHSYFDDQGHQPWSHHYIVTGMGGVRTDFVASWLASITELFNPWSREWTMDPITGASLLARHPLFDHIKVSDQVQGNQTINGFEELLRSTHDSTALKSVSKSHVHYVALDHYVPHVFKRDFTAVHIVYPKDIEDIITVTWEYIVKTFLRRCTSRKSHVRTNIKIMLDNNPLAKSINAETDTGCQQAIELIIDYMVNNIIRIDEFSGPNPRLLNYQPLQYAKIAAVGGGQYIADKLSLDIDPWYFDLYDRAVTVSPSPNKITAFGKTWYKNDMAERIKNVYT